jgi:hypothetical protein
LSVVPLISVLRALRPSGLFESSWFFRKTCGRSIPSVMPEQGDQDDDRKRYADKPEQSSTTQSHSVLLFVIDQYLSSPKYPGR